LYWGIRRVVILILCDGGIGVGVVTLILTSIIWCPSSRQVHWYLYIVVGQTGCIGGIVSRPLLLLLLLWPLLVLLRTSSPGSWPKLILILSECVVESSWVGDSLPSPDKFDHLSAFRDVDRFCFVFVVVLREWVSDNFF
jgi:hypothetical protein